ncbi:hypothetical protein [Lacunimicrobium album]
MSNKKKQQKKLEKAIKKEMKEQKKSGAVKEIGWKLTHFLLLGRIIAKFNDIAEKIYDYWW